MLDDDKINRNYFLELINQIMNPTNGILPLSRLLSLIILIELLEPTTINDSVGKNLIQLNHQLETKRSVAKQSLTPIRILIILPADIGIVFIVPPGHKFCRL